MQTIGTLFSDPSLFNDEEASLENIRGYLELENKGSAAIFAIRALSDLIEEQRRGDEIIVRHKKDGGFWGCKFKDYRIDFLKGERHE